ncbi:hypothetical protein E4K10_26850 [Streptomyces sp. T1317-0309]|nr:hypothetical protein E4K10_26850 [Streptomyces sp. T1317-0309]
MAVGPCGDRTACGHRARHPNLTVVAPFPLEAAAAPLFSPTRRFGTLTAFWLSVCDESSGGSGNDWPPRPRRWPVTWT